MKEIFRHVKYVRHKRHRIKRDVYDLWTKTKGVRTDIQRSQVAPIVNGPAGPWTS